MYILLISILLSVLLKYKCVYFMMSTNQSASAPLGTAMDSLSQALKCNILPNQEYLLQGSVLDSAVEALLHR